MQNCNFCEKSFNLKIGLHAHMIKAHQILEKDDSEDETIPDTSKDKDESNFKKCDCDICENISVILNSHVSQDHNISSTTPSGCEACNFLTKACHEMSKIHLKKFECEQCEVSFNQENFLEKHKKLVHEGQFKCDTCGKCFNRKSNLKDHVRSVHYKIKEFPCGNCDKTFARKPDAKKHMDTAHSEYLNIYSSKEIFPCTLCGKTFDTESKINKHLAKPCQEDSINRISTKLEKVDLDRVQAVQDEYKLMHFMANQNSPENNESEKDDSENNLEIDFDVVDEFVDFVDDPMPNNARKFGCNLCDKKFEKPYNLKIHMKSVHSKIKEIPCDFCDKKFTRVPDARKHMVNFHGSLENSLLDDETKPKKPKIKREPGIMGPQHFVCMHCGKKFDRNWNLSVHIKSVHEKIKDIKCDFCDKMFGRKPDAKKHMQICSNRS